MSRLRSYGEYKHFPADLSPTNRSCWEVTADPHVIGRFKRVFPRADQQRDGVQTLTDTLEVARDLTWFMDRWPLTPVDDASRVYLEARADAHRAAGEQVAAILAGHRPDYGWRDPTLPARPYQQIVADLVHTTGRLLCGDEPGLGKTVSGGLVLRNPAALPALVVTLTHLTTQWERELNRFFPWLSCHIIRTGTPYDPAARRGSGGREPDVLIVNYHKLAGWGHHLAGKIKAIVFDEMQELRHRETRKYEAAALITDRADYKVGLTATPVYNYGDEIHSLMSLLDPDALGSRDEFLREWGGDDYGQKRTRVADPRALGSHLRDVGLMLRRTRADVGRELPEVSRIEQPIDTDHKVLEEMSDGIADMARLVLDQDADRDARFQAAGQLNSRLRHATGVAKAPHVAEFCKLLLETEQKIVLFGWHRDCFAPGTKILMHDGSVKNVEDIREGEQVMGPDSKPRNVQALIAGTGKLYRVVPHKGEPWICSENHILTVWNGRRYQTMTAREYAEAPARWQRDRSLYRAEAVTFSGEQPVLEPWLMGYWLGDGAADLRDLRIASADPEVGAEMQVIAERHGLSVSVWASPGVTGTSQAKHMAFSSGRRGPKNRNTLVRHFRSLGLHKNKHIPRSYLTASVEDRLELLAGLIDSDGYVYRGNSVGSASYATICPNLARDVTFLARSLGLAAYVAKKQSGVNSYGGSCVYYSVNLSGDLTIIPTRVERKRANARAGHKNVLRTGFKVEPAGVGNFYGFEVDDDHLFLLADFTVVHNCYEVWMRELRAYYPVLYTGTESPTQKEANANAFVDGDARILIMSLRSGAGLNGLQHAAKTCVFGELDWSPAQHHQAIGRLHRDGQTDPVMAFFLVSDGGADPAIAEILDLKRQQADPIVDPDAEVIEPSAAAAYDRVRTLAADVLRRRGLPVPDHTARPAVPAVQIPSQARRRTPTQGVLL